MARNILITGATGCVGHYTVELLQKQYPEDQLYLLVRDPKKFKGQLKNVHCLAIALDDTPALDKQLQRVDVLILIATHWGSWQKCKQINVDNSLSLCEWSVAKGCERILYYSTASILDEKGKVMPKAYEMGTSYVRSKYLAYKTLRESPFSDKVYALFPTLVLGSEKPYPISHFSVGIGHISKYFFWLSKIKIDASFQFLHARDIAAVSLALLTDKSSQRDYILGAQALSFQEAISIFAEVLNKPSGFKIPFSRSFIAFLLKVLRIKHTNWDKYCLKRGHFVFDAAVAPSNFGEPTIYPDFKTVLVKDACFQ